MATIIDTLVVKLGLDTSDYDKGNKKLDSNLKDAGKKAKDAGKKIKEGAKEGSDGFREMAGEATKFLAIIGGTAAVTSFVQSTIEGSAAMERFAKNIGISVENVSAWSNTAEVAGGSAKGLQGTFDMLSKSQTELQLTGNSSILPYLSALGVSASEATGPVNDLLLVLSDKFAALGDRNKANNIGQMMGIDAGTMNLLLQGRGAVEAMLRAQKESNAVTKQQAEQMERTRQQTVLIKQEFNAFGRELVSEAIPILDKLFTMFDGFGDWCKEHSDFITAFLTALAGGLGLVAAAATPINLTAAGIVSLGAAIALLYDDYQTYKKGGETLIPWKEWDNEVQMAEDVLNRFKNFLQDLFFRQFSLFGGVNDILKGRFSSGWEKLKDVITGDGQDYGRTDSAGGGAPKAPAAKGNSRDAAMAYFQSQGWSKEQAAGLAANIHTESGFNPSAVGDSGKAYGIGQWHPDRQAAFKNLFGKSIQGSSFEEQLAFMQYELTQGNEKGAGARLRGARSASDAGAIVSRYYERPADVSGEMARRGALAQSFLGIPGASQAGMASGAVASAGSTRNNSTSIGEIKVYTQATDAQGIANDLGGAMNDYLAVSQANAGLM